MSDEAAHPAARTSSVDGRRAADSSAAALASALKDGPRGALLLSALAVAVLFVCWIAFYLLCFLTRGSIG